MTEIFKQYGTPRYGEILIELLTELNAIEVLNLKYENDYQGFVDISALLSDGRVFSFLYYYGSCNGCDDWESRELNNEQVKDEMKQHATFFDNIEQYKHWQTMCAASK